MFYSFQNDVNLLVNLTRLFAMYNWGIYHKNLPFENVGWPALVMYFLRLKINCTIILGLIYFNFSLLSKRKNYSCLFSNKRKSLDLCDSGCSKLDSILHNNVLLSSKAHDSIPIEPANHSWNSFLSFVVVQYTKRWENWKSPAKLVEQR